MGCYIGGGGVCQKEEGLKINVGKSTIAGVGVQDNVMEGLASLTGCSRSNLPLTYLGVPNGGKMNISRSWQPIKDTLKKRLSLWKSKSLSFGERITLIQSVLSSLPLYYFSLFPAPNNVIEELERIRRTFFWGGAENVKKIHWVRWSQVISPKESGGLGIGSLKAANLALLSKWHWRYKEDTEGLWRRVINAVHTNRSNSDADVPISAATAGVWKAIGRGISSMTESNVDLQQELIALGQSFHTSHIRSLLNKACVDPNPSDHKWNNWTPIKANIHMWRLLMGRIPTRIALARRGLNISDLSCPLCEEDAESHEHLFTECNFTNQLWGRISSWLGVNPIYAFSVMDLENHHTFMSGSPHRKKCMQAIIMTAIWCLWIARNQKVHEGTRPNLDKIMGEIMTTSLLWISNRSKKKIDWRD